jgi:hypothetical protein
MAAEQSQFSRLPKKQLVRIAEKLVDEGFDTDNPYEDYDDNYKILSSIGKYFNIDVVDEDVQFFAKFIDINDNLLSKVFEPNGDKSLIEQLVIPVAKTYELQYSTWGSCSYEEYLAQKFDSYDEDWVRDSAEQQRQDGNWDTYDGYNRRDPYYDNFEESDMSYDKVVEVDDSTNVRESLLDRLVVENTSEVVNSLDKQTLLKLKQIIESRLRSL